jgi:hypothetical protein
MKLESVSDWMAYLSHTLWKARETVGMLPKEDPRWFDAGEELSVLTQDTEAQIRMLVKRAMTLAKQNRIEKKAGDSL